MPENNQNPIWPLQMDKRLKRKYRKLKHEVLDKRKRK